MLVEVKKCADSGDVKGLRYIFADCLDVDPTFEKYKLDYEYCKNIKGFFQPHEEKSGLLLDSNQWNQQYWEKLKLDLMKNFSEKRFNHMVEVAQIVYADKVSRLLSERNKKSESVVVSRSGNVPAGKVKITDNTVFEEKKLAEEKKIVEEARIAEERRKIEENNRRVEAEQKAQRERIAEKRKAMNQQNNTQESSVSKKWMGIVVVVAIIVVVFIVIAVKSSNPQ